MVDQQRPAEPTGGSDSTTGRSDAQPFQSTGRDRTQDATEMGRAKGGEMKEKTREQAEDLMSRGRDAISQARDTAAAEVDRRSSEIADRLGSVVRALQTAADQLEDDGQSWLANYTRRAAGQVDRVTGYLHDEDAPAMLGDLEEMARTNPGTFLGTSFAAGVAVGRFLRSSKPSPHDGQNGHERRGWDGGSTDYGTQVTGGGGYPAATRGTSSPPDVPGTPTSGGMGREAVEQRPDEHRGGPHGTSY